MTKIITFEDIQEYTNEKRYKSYNNFIIPTNLGEGGIKYLDLSNGLGIHQIDIKVKEDFIIENKFEDTIFAFSSFLKGELSYQNKDFDFDKRFKTNHLSISALNQEHGLSFYKKGLHIKAINIVVNEKFLKNNIIDENKDSYINNIFETLKDKPYFGILKDSPCSFDTINSLNTIFSNNFTNKFQKLLIQSQTYDFLFNCFSNLDSIDKNHLPEIEKQYLLKVEKYILENLHKDLSLIQLAKIASSNETKFQKNFKLFFGMTVFKYILECRMRNAKELLKTGDYSIKEVAFLVGYKFQSNFSSAFLKKFNILPKEIIKTKDYY